MEMSDGRLVQVRRRDADGAGAGGGGGGKEIVGVEPIVWDAGLGNKHRREYADDANWRVGDEEDDGDEKRDEMEEDDDDDAEVEVDGSWGEEWKVSIASPLNEQRYGFTDLVAVIRHGTGPLFSSRIYLVIPSCSTWRDEEYRSIHTHRHAIARDGFLSIDHLIEDFLVV